MREQKSGLEEQLAESLKRLSVEHSFDKVTIKDITEAAMVSRPTFYNHFQDKYDLLAWILVTEVLEPVKLLLEHDMTMEAIIMLFGNLLKDKAFYQSVVKTQGQNSFAETLRDTTQKMLEEIFRKHIRPERVTDFWQSPENLSRYYAWAIQFAIVSWIENGFQESPRKVAEILHRLMTTSLEDIIEGLGGDD